jgi:hypothetical protein
VRDRAAAKAKGAGRRELERGRANDSSAIARIDVDDVGAGT